MHDRHRKSEVRPGRAASQPSASADVRLRDGPVAAMQSAIADRLELGLPPMLSLIPERSRIDGCVAAFSRACGPVLLLAAYAATARLLFF